jgi:hypothetical protein
MLSRLCGFGSVTQLSQEAGADGSAAEHPMCARRRLKAASKTKGPGCVEHGAQPFVVHRSFGNPPLPGAVVQLPCVAIGSQAARRFEISVSPLESLTG